MSATESAAERLLSLRQFHQDGRRAPNKPLLVLLALERLASTGSSELRWSDTGTRLGELIGEFGPWNQGSVLQRAAYPFTHLRSDGVWQLSSDVPMDAIRPLNESDATGRLSSSIEDELLAHPERIPELARRIVDAQWPATVAPDVLTAVGFDADAVGASPVALDPERRRRSAAWRNQILSAWDAACAFCGFDGSVAGAPVGIEAAHVRWFNIGGPDDLDNGLALCSLHHKLFDRGALGLSADYRVEVSQGFRAVGAGRAVYDLHGVELRPRPGTQLPAEQYVAWHRTQVFHGEPLAS